jgi:hypothetical protein
VFLRRPFTVVPPGEVVVEAPLLGDDFVEMRPHTVLYQYNSTQ